MELNPESLGHSLETFLKGNKIEEAKLYMEQLNSVLADELTPALVDSYIVNIFNQETGLLVFIKKAPSKQFKDSVLVAFEIIYTVVNSFCSKVKQYVESITDICLAQINSQAPAMVKDKALILLILTIENPNITLKNNNGEKIYKNLKNCFSSRLDKSMTVQEKITKALGAFIKRYQWLVDSDKVILRKMFMNLLEGKQGKSANVMSGAYFALSDYLDAFGEFDDNSVNEKLLSFIRQMIKPTTAHNHVPRRAAVSLLSKHLSLFLDKMYTSCREWHEELCNLLKESNVENKKVAYSALMAFYEEIAKKLIQEKGDKHKGILLYLIEHFKKNISDTNASNFEMRLAISGYGIFSEACVVHLSQNEITKMFTDILQEIEHIYMVDTDLNNEQMENLPFYVQTFTKLMKQVSPITNYHIRCLQCFLILMIKSFSNFSQLYHNCIVEAFVMTSSYVSSIQSQNAALDDFYDIVIYQGVMWTCSHDMVVDADLLKEHMDVVTYKNFLPFWIGLFKFLESDKIDFDYTERMTLREIFFDELMKSLMVLISKLNLNVKPKKEDMAVTNPETSLEAVKVNDFVIFVNIVDFYQDIFENVPENLFKKWVTRFINNLIEKSVKLPLVSGFYKLLGSALKLCDVLDYFDERRLSREEINTCFKSMENFLMSLLQRMKQYKGDLQIACLQILLNAPVCFIENLLSYCTPAFIALFSTSKSNLRQVEMGLHTLERWFYYLPAETTRPFLHQILPYLDTFMRSKSSGSNVHSKSVIKTRKTKQLLRKRRILVEAESELYKLQKSIAMFIGKLDRSLCCTFVNSVENVETLTWSKNKYLKLKLSFKEVQLDIYLENFLPRIVELALNCSNRKTRVMACESLHAATIYIWGISRSNKDGLSDLDSLFKKIAFPLLQLGCDADFVVLQLFHPLLLQLMHYYANEKRSAHTAIFIETLMVGITHPTDSALRDLSGECIREFVHWTIKQSTKSQLEADPINIKIIIDRIISFSQHPDPNMRLGAALIFNNIYTLMREEESLVNIFWLELLHAFIVNISFIKDESSADINCLEQVTDALKHLQRVFVEKSSLFNKKSKKRRIPPNFHDGLLEDVAFFLLDRTGSLRQFCRKRCIEMFCKIAPLVNKCNNSINAFINNNVDEEDWVIKKYEFELSKMPTLKDIKHSEALDDMYLWFDCLLCALDGYIFVIENSLMETFSINSKLFESLRYFLQYVQNTNLTFKVSIIEKETFTSYKIKVINNILSLAAVLLKTNKMDICSGFWEDSLWSLIVGILFEPIKLGFDRNTKLLDQQKVVVDFINLLTEKFSEEKVFEVANYLSDYVKKQLDTFSLNTLPIPLNQRLLIKGMLLLEGSSLGQKLNFKQYGLGITQKIFFEFLEKTGGENLVEHTLYEYCNTYLELSLLNESELPVLINCIFDETEITSLESDVKFTYGEYFFSKFHDVIVNSFVENVDKCLTVIFEKGINYKHVLQYLTKVFTDQSKDRFTGNKIRIVVNTILKYWSKFVPFLLENSTNILLGLELLSRLVCVSPDPVYTFATKEPAVGDWIIELLTYREKNWSEQNAVNFKIQAIHILPCVTGPRVEENVKLKNGLQILKNRHYSKSSTTSKTSKAILFDKLLDVLSISKSPTILEAVADIYKTSGESLKAEALIKYIKYPDFNFQETSIEMIYKMSLNSTFSEGYKLGADILTVLLERCSYKVCVKFFEENISFIGRSVKKALDKDNMLEKTIMFMLIEVLFLKFNRDDLERNNIPNILIGISENPVKDFLKDLTTCLLSTPKDVAPDNSDQAKEHFRLYQCHSYKALVSLISSTQKDVAYYTLLFKEHFWKNMLDLDKKYVFPQDFSIVPKQRKILVKIRNERKERRQHTGDIVDSIKYMRTQHLFNSTLSEDVSKFDFTNTVLRNQSQQDEYNFVETQQNFQTQTEIVLEAIDINNHECMPVLCGVIQHMVTNDIHVLKDNSVNGLPKWMEELHKVLSNNETHPNVKMFLIKVIENNSEVFKPYMKWFLVPIVKFINDGCCGNEINFFIADLITLITSPDERIALEEPDKQQLLELFKFLIRNAYSERQDMFKYNLELIKLTVEAFKNDLLIPYDLICATIQENNNKKICLGLHVTAILLANKIEPWPSNRMVDFVKIFCKILGNPEKTVYQPCSETVGLILDYVQKNHLQEYSDILRSVKTTLDKTNDDNKFIYCLEGITRHDPQIVDNYVLKLLLKIQTKKGNIRSIYLRILLSRIDCVKNVRDLYLLDFDSMLKDPNVDIQVLILQIIKECHQQIPLKNRLMILEVFKGFVKHANSKCRSLMYDILFLFVNCSESELRVKSNDILINGLVDEDEEIQEKVYGYYTDTKNLSEEVIERFIKLLSCFYKTHLEDSYLGYCTYLMLDLLKGSELFDKKIFDYMKASWDLQEYDINIHWKAQHATLAPMFADTFKSYESLVEPTSVMQPGFLRATLATLAFTPTQKTREDRSETVFSNTNSSLLLSLDETAPSINTFKNPNDVFGSRYRRRFKRDTWKISREFATREVTKIRKREEERRESTLKKERSIDIYRKYRKGDLPDIEILFKDLMKPLQLLSKEDLEIGRIMYTSLANNIIEQIKTKPIFVENIKKSIIAIFNSSTRYVPNVMSAFLDVALAQKDTIKFEPDIISEVCLSGGLLSLGALLLEEYLISNQNTEVEAKRSRGVETVENLHWVKLAGLYREMDEWDTVKAIFVEKMGCTSQHLMEAFCAESYGEWKTAKENYQQLITEDNSFYRKDFYYESYFKCFASISEWKDLSETIQKVLGSNNIDRVWIDIWDEDWNQRVLLPWFMKSQVRTVLKNKTRLPNLMANLNSLFKEPEKSEYIKETFPEELSVLRLLDKNFNVSEQNVQNYVASFLENWGQINPLFSKVRFSKLLNLQNVVDIHTFVNQLDNLHIHNYKSAVKFLLKFWKETSCDHLQDIIFNETRTLYRQEFLVLLNEKLKAILFDDDDDDDDEDDVFPNIKATEKALSDDFVDVALKQKNYYVAKKYFDDDNKFSLSKLSLLYESLVQDPEKKLKCFAQAWQLCDSLLKKQDLDDNTNLSISDHLFDVTLKFSNFLSKETALLDKVIEDVAKFCNIKISNFENIADFGAENLHKSITACEENRTVVPNGNLGDAYVKLAYFAQEKVHLEENFICFVLKAMKLSCLEGIQLFPCILNLRSLSCSNKDVFIRQVEDTPSWMFLGWIPQLLASLDTTKVYAVFDIILRIATEYPQAIIYAYKLTREKYYVSDDEIGLYKQDCLNKLDKLLLQDKIYDEFLKALSFVGVPQVLLQYHIKKLTKACQQNSVEAFKREHQKMKELCTAVSAKNKIKFRGKIFEQIDQNVARIDGMEKKKFNPKEFLKLLDGIEVKWPKSFSSKLIDYSPWLYGFHLNNTTTNLEIPGQYDGQKRPLLQYHVKIAGFKEFVFVQASLRRPIKLTILGNDGKEYPFLVKSGEDLRQDQRIEQLFTLMNNIFKSDAVCSQQNLNVFTYQVIPLTTQLGIIQWVEDCLELLNFIKSGFKSESEAKGILEKTVEKYRSWVGISKQCNVSEKYAMVFCEKSRENTIAKYSTLVNEIPWDVLRVAFRKECINTESFVALRHNFVKSYSVMCIAHWILGIGDRHLGNSMLSLKKGEVVGIDFGHAFGTGTQVLEVPELVPFRLTPHIINILQPLNEHGMFKETMIHTLRALRKNHNSLVATMKVFIEDPSIDWLEHATRSQNFGEETSQDWYSERKISEAKSKLDGVNPVTVMVEELRAGHSSKPNFLKSCIALVEGSKENDIRARKNKTDLTAEEQVAFLIDQATDYNLLGRMWEGWQAWI